MAVYLWRMILIPQRLFTDPRVRTLLRHGNACWLHKTLTTPTLDREGYVSNHAVSIVLAGEQRIRPYEAPTIRVRAGEVLLIPRGMYHITDLLPESGGAFESVLCYFDDTAIQAYLAGTRVAEFTRNTPPDHLRLREGGDIQAFARTLLHLYRGAEAANTDLLHHKTQELLHLAARTYGEQALAHFLFNLTLPRKRSLTDFMEQHYAKPLKVEDYAYLTGRSVRSFRRDFKEQFDRGPQQWLKDRRLARAEELLRAPDILVSDVAAEIGYDNTSYFIREFRKRTGLSPGAYRRENFN